jgi:cyclic beta-1,2-glucan synthetase
MSPIRDSSVSGQTADGLRRGLPVGRAAEDRRTLGAAVLLRFVLLENLRRIASRVERSRKMRAQANEVADEAGDASTIRTKASRMLRSMRKHARTTPSPRSCSIACATVRSNAGKALIWLEGELEKRGSDAEEIIVGEHQRCRAATSRPATSSAGLRLINDVDWTRLVRGVSRIDALLREKHGDFANWISIARPVPRGDRRPGQPVRSLSEYEVAKGDDLASGSENRRSATPTRHRLFPDRHRAGGTGKAIDYKPTFGTRLHGAVPAATGWIGIVMLPVMALTMLLLGMAAAALSRRPSDGSIVLLVILFAVPAGEGALAFFNTVVLQFLKPTRLRRLRIQGRHSGRCAHAGRGALSDLQARRCRGTGAQSRGSLPRQSARRDLFRAAVSDWADSQVGGNARRSRTCSTMPSAKIADAEPPLSPMTGARASTSCTAAASTIRRKGAGWAGSASAASCTS